MKPTLVHDIIEKLALGVDPVTDSPLHNESIFHHPTVIRALFLAKDAVKLQNHAQSSAWKKWEEDDRLKLLALFRQEVPIRDIAHQLGRSTGGVIAKLVREGALKDRDEGRALMVTQDAQQTAKV
ncbi:hypothetical protein ACHMW6_28830 [Pseudoduganella sp. UC29_106]|uniref:hypothetical protein n=1 Tax=Pseudoduganella sp. UC29_106 TaxID=3374553 RepID=UPI003757CFEA